MMLRPGARVLDVGCGWGGMAIYLALVCGAEVTGITLSAEQLRVATRRAEEAGLAGRVTFRLQDYRDVTDRFDAAVSVGMLEHVGLGRMRDYMAMVARVLKPEGVMLLHSICNPRPSPYTSAYIAKHIFPGGRIPALSQIVAPAEAAGLLFREIKILPLHYAETLREWRRRFLAARDAVLDLYDERFLRMWEFYLAGSEMAFRHRDLHVVHLEIVRDHGRLPIVRGFVEEEMARLRGIEAVILPPFCRTLRRLRFEL
jgi:cyclopropane-fatty-acyl-phospholipid synthase